MRAPQAAGWTRRRFLSGLTLAGTAGVFGLHPRLVAAEPPPETTALRLARTASICQASQYMVEALFEAEGFTDVQFVGETAAAELCRGPGGAGDGGL
jgi:NitT/TauT family transport system substrate-binding protein